LELQRVYTRNGNKCATRSLRALPGAQVMINLPVYGHQPVLSAARGKSMGWQKNSYSGLVERLSKSTSSSSLSHKSKNASQSNPNGHRDQAHEVIQLILSVQTKAKTASLQTRRAAN